MAQGKKKGGAKKKSTRRRSTSAPARRSRRGPRKMSILGSLAPLLLTAGGAMVADRVAAMIPGKDDRIRWGVVTIGSLFAARKMPQLAPAFMGIATIGAVSTVRALAPNLFKSGKGTRTLDTVTGSFRLGRLTEQEVHERVNAALQKRAALMGREQRPSINGPRFLGRAVVGF